MAIATASVVVGPIVIFILSLVQPCMPPLISSLILASCQTWGDVSGPGFLFRIVIGFFEWYTWTIIMGIVSFAVMILLLYPVEIKLLFIAMMERYLLRLITTNLLTCTLSGTYSIYITEIEKIADTSI